MKHILSTVPSLLTKKNAFIFLCLCVVVIVSLEIASRRCVQDATRGTTQCLDLKTKYINSPTLSMFLPQSYSLDAVLQNYVIEVSPADMNQNGLACSPYAFIRTDLPKYAKKYVATHEAFHVTGITSEFGANYRAALKHPYGLVETVVFTVFDGFKGKSLTQYPCVLGGYWRQFKVYFLGVN